MAHGAHETIEHAGHEGGHGGGMTRVIGMTVALLGVLLAVCSAQLGAARTDLISTMVEEASAKERYSATSNKYRSLEATLQQIHAAMPDPAFLAKKDQEMKALREKVTNPETRQGLQISQLQTQELLNTVVPTPEDVDRFLKLIDRTREQNEAAKEWSESYGEAVEVHKHSAERFERALLCVEIGIVIASVGLLMAKQVRMATGAWGIAVVLGLASLGIAGTTYFNSRHALGAAEQKIHHGKHLFDEKNKEDEEVAEDRQLEKDIREVIPELKKIMTGGSGE